MAIEIVDFPIEIGDFPIVMLVYQRVSQATDSSWDNPSWYSSDKRKIDYNWRVLEHLEKHSPFTSIYMAHVILIYGSSSSFVVNADIRLYLPHTPSMEHLLTCPCRIAHMYEIVYRFDST